MELNRQQQAVFVEALWAFYARHGRGDLPWRLPEPDGAFDPYKIMVSELMLQQTQVLRVIPKYQAFVHQFPTIHALARADLGEVLRAWQGLGYNRRAKYLWQAAGQVARLNRFPDTVAEFVKLPGIGPNTAGAIQAYAYNQPAIFVETNIRTVYLHHFLQDQTEVPDRLITMLLQQTLDREQPREFYWALMDYGSHLKSTVGNLNSASKHYAKQSQFNGSRRQVRGQVLRSLSVGSLSVAELEAAIADARLVGVLADLLREGLVRQTAEGYYAL